MTDARLSVLSGEQRVTVRTVAGMSERQGDEMGWLQAMERAQIEAWLQQGLVVHVHALNGERGSANISRADVPELQATSSATIAEREVDTLEDRSVRPSANMQKHMGLSEVPPRGATELPSTQAFTQSDASEQPATVRVHELRLDLEPGWEVSDDRPPRYTASRRADSTWQAVAHDAGANGPALVAGTVHAPNGRSDLSAPLDVVTGAVSPAISASTPYAVAAHVPVSDSLSLTSQKAEHLQAGTAGAPVATRVAPQLPSTSHMRAYGAELPVKELPALESRGRSDASSPGRRSPVGSGPLRVHADWTAEGVRIWLGMDVQLLGQAEAIAQQLRRWVSTQGVRVLSLACNGQIMEGAARVTDEDEARRDGPVLPKRTNRS